MRALVVMESLQLCMFSLDGCEGVLLDEAWGANDKFVCLGGGEASS